MTDITGSNTVSDGYNKPYTPTTEEVYRAHWRGTPMRSEDGLREHVALDRWLAKRDQKLMAQAWDRGYEAGLTDFASSMTTNPYRQGETE